MSLFLVSIFAFKLYILVTRQATIIKKDTFVNISNQLTPPEEIGKNGISLAFMISDERGHPNVDDERYGVY